MSGHTFLSVLSLGETSDLTYCLTCFNCPSQYVGETARPLKHRITGHKKDSSLFGPTLKLYLHGDILPAMLLKSKQASEKSSCKLGIFLCHIVNLRLNQIA